MRMRSLAMGVFVMVVVSGCAAMSVSGNREQGLTLYYGEYAQVELISAKGTRVLIDVHNPEALSAEAAESDVLLTTHMHPDHVNATFMRSFPGEHIKSRTGELTLEDVVIHGIASTHTSSAYDKPRDSDGTNYVYLVEVGGLRVAHFGDIGQDELSAEQLAALGEVDVAVMQLSNSYSDMNAANQKGFNLIAQVAPKLLILTHYDEATFQQARETWDTYWAANGPIVIRPSDLADGETKLLVMGDKGSTYGENLGLSAWSHLPE